MGCGDCGGECKTKGNPLKMDKSIVIEADKFEEIYKDKFLNTEEISLLKFEVVDRGVMLCGEYNWSIRKDGDKLLLIPMKKCRKEE